MNEKQTKDNRRIKSDVAVGEELKVSLKLVKIYKILFQNEDGYFACDGAVDGFC